MDDLMNRVEVLIEEYVRAEVAEALRQERAKLFAQVALQEPKLTGPLPKRPALSLVGSKKKTRKK